MRELLTMAGEMYLPFLAANARACENNEPEVVAKMLGTEFRQAPFRYQATCFAWLRAEFSRLEASELERIEPVLRDTGCWGYFMAR